MEKARKELVQGIEKTFDTLLDELSKFDAKTLCKAPFEGSWTAGQTTEHVIICGSGIPDSRTIDADRPYDEMVEPLKKLFLDYSIRFEADPSLLPRSESHIMDELVLQVNTIKGQLKGIAATSDLKAVCLDMEFPSFGLLTRHEWLWFIMFHTQRHTHQIKNIGKHLASA